MIGRRLVRTFSPVRMPGAKGAPRQVWEMLHWGARLIVTPNDYRAHGLYLHGRSEAHALRYLSAPRAKSMMWPLNREHERLENKLVFESHFGSLGLPVPKTLAVFGPGGQPSQLPALADVDSQRQFLVQTVLMGTEVAVKPLDAWGGAGVLIITQVSDGSFLLSNGEKMAIEDVMKHVSVGSWLVQERIVQHQDLAELNPSSLNTMRLGTFRRQDGRVDIIFAKLRMGRSSAQLDSNSLGGLSVWIDPTSGAFVRSATQFPKYSLEHFDKHPDSGVCFSGRIYPHWEAVVSLARKFAENAGDNVFVGWDVATTQEGPVFVEGNHNWDVQMAQTGSAGMLTDDFVAMFRAETGHDIDVSKHPAVRPLSAYRALRKAQRR